MQASIARAIHAALLCAALTACEAPDPAAPAAAAKEDSAILGNWTVTALDGRSFPIGSAPGPIEVSFGPEAIHAQSQCIPFDWRYSVEGRRLRIHRVPDQMPVCERGRTAEEELFPRIMDAATAISVTKAGRMSITGPAGVAILGRSKAQAAQQPPASVRRPEPVLPDPDLMQGKWVVAAIGGDEQPPRSAYIHVNFGRDVISAQSQCIPFRWSYAELDGRLSLVPKRLDEPICLRPLSFWEAAFRDVMNSASQIELREEDMLVYSANGIVQLRREQ
jgi:hypothetical protein